MFFPGLKKAAESEGVHAVVNHIGSMGSLFFTAEPVTDFATATAGDLDLFSRYYKSMLGNGIYLAPSAFEAGFLSTSHSEEVMKKTIDHAAEFFRSLNR